MTLKNIRKVKGVSANRLAEILNIALPSYYAKERGIRKFSAEEIQILCRTLKVKITDIEL